MKSRHRLTSAFVTRASEPGCFYDGPRSQGLALIVRATKSGGVTRRYVQRLRINGKPTMRAIAHADEIGLAEARAKALENWLAVREGRALQRHRSTSTAPTFEALAQRVIAANKSPWAANTLASWQRSLKLHAYPAIGRQPVDRITTADLLEFVGPLVTTLPGTARQIVPRLRKIFDHAIAHRHCSENPVNALRGALPKPAKSIEHSKALPHREVRAALDAIRACDEFEALRLLAQFVVLTAVRGGEARGAVWSEIDIEQRTWTIPPSRMKSRREHVVPLSDQAIAVLEQARTIGASEFVFERDAGKPVNAKTLSELLRGLNIGAVMHGFRSSFRDWAGETGQPRDVAEACLAHAFGSSTERAYARSSLLARRREVMQAWADYIAPDA